MYDDVRKNVSPYTIIYKQDGVYLSIYPSKIVDKISLFNEIIDKVTKKQIKDVDRKAIKEAIEEANGQPVKIAEKQEEVKIDASLNIKVSPDKMKATLTLTPPDGGKELDFSQMMEIIRSKGVVWGIDELLIAELAANPRYNEPIDFAEGTPPIKGEDGRVEILFNINTDKKPTILEDGSVDFHELNYVEGVKKGQVLAKIIPAGSGIDGKNVCGQVLHAPKGKPVRNPKGKNVEIIDDKVIASIDGYASYVDDKINVLTILEIPGNVDISTGNIRFNGNVIIKGNVLTDFVVEATGDVEVFGVVEGATIKADGNIILKRGIQGLHKGKLISGNDIVAKFIEHCTVVAKNDIKCEAIMHSNVSCGGIIELGGRKGLIVGGNIKVGKEILAKVIGSPMSTATNLEVGLDPEKRERYKELKEQYNNLQLDLDRIDKSIGVLRKMQSSGTITPQNRIRLMELLKRQEELSQKLEEMQEELDRLDEELSEAQRGRIKVRQVIYPGVKITIGNVSKFIKDPQEFVTFHLDGVDIKATPYDSY